jgi:hypothetical protein
MTSIERTAYPRFTPAPSVKELREIYTPTPTDLAFVAITVEALRKAGAHFRNDIVTGIGGKQILVDDPSGNPIELFEPTLPEARLSSNS